MLELLKARVAPQRVADGLVTFLNPYSYLLMRREQQLLSQFDLVHYDGLALAALMKSIGVRCERVSFDATSLAPSVLADSAERGLGLYLIGGEPGIVETARDILLQQHSGLNVTGTRHGFFSSQAERAQFIAELAALNPDVVVVGMGTPLQERFLVDLRAAGWRGCGYTCGGFFHQTAKRGAVYYPPLINRLNLRFLYRMWDEPKLTRRYLIDYPKFLAVFAADVVSFAWQRFVGRQS
jgi:exopolysaccharide biosynthesis WecB/TagA/CpsF family protein